MFVSTQADDDDDEKHKSRNSTVRDRYNRITLIRRRTFLDAIQIFVQRVEQERHQLLCGRHVARQHEIEVTNDKSRFDLGVLLLVAREARLDFADQLRVLFLLFLLWFRRDIARSMR